MVSTVRFLRNFDRHLRFIPDLQHFDSTNFLDSINTMMRRTNIGVPQRTRLLVSSLMIINQPFRGSARIGIAKSHERKVKRVNRPHITRLDGIQTIAHHSNNLGLIIYKEPQSDNRLRDSVHVLLLRVLGRITGRVAFIARDPSNGVTNNLDQVSYNRIVYAIEHDTDTSTNYSTNRRDHANSSNDHRLRRTSLRSSFLLRLLLLGGLAT